MLVRRLAPVVLSALLVIAPYVLDAPAHASVMPAPTALVNGGDVSWPNCPKGMGIPSRPALGLPMPTRSARFVVLGATNGPAFTRNPCLASQARWVKARHLWVSAYAVIHYPSSAELRQYGGTGSITRRLARVGAAEARHAMATLKRAGVPRRMVWVDVETVGGRPWSSRPTYNNAVLSGVLAQYRAYGVRTGVYSYAYAWKKITGGRASTLPTWVPSGTNSRTKALARCSQRSFSGGRVLMGQWSDGTRDYDVTCRGVARSMRTWFTST